jgi:streptogramin lyase
VDEHDGIWFVNSSPDNSVYHIDPTTGQVSDFGEPPQLNRIFLSESQMVDDLKKINIDNQGRIWISYFDRLELDDNGKYHWKSLELPAVMVETFDPSYAYVWANTRSSLVTSNGDIWFTTTEGIAKYDMSSGTWCLSAVTRDNGSPAIIEDVEGNLWTIDRRQIYKLENQK